MVVYWNICFPNIACNTVSMWLKSAKFISHDQGPTTLMVGDFIG